MGFRRDKSEAEDARRWKRFLHEAGSALSAAGVPSEVFETRRRFDLFLMHGEDQAAQFYLRPHGDYLAEDAQYRALVQMCSIYRAVGLADPGIAILKADDLASLDLEPAAS